ncbi:hypothetical protein ACROYT_G018482 [Oculina patagonica]
MGTAKSSLRHKGSTPYNIYATNKTDGIRHLYLRLQGDKLVDSETYLQLKCNTPTEATDVDRRRWQEERLFSTVIQAGFHLLQPGIPKRFNVVNRDVPMYASVHDGYNLWITDMPVEPSKYGCVAIKGDEQGIEIQPSNPSPLWLPGAQGDPIPEGIMQANKANSSRQMYFGRSHGKLCFVETKHGRLDYWRAMFDEYKKQLSGDLLLDTGFDVIEARRGDLLPPNTLLIDGVYVGRNIGEYLCPMDVRDQKVWEFQSIFKISSKKGEIVVMTNDPHY